jgi:hypothetical protein
MSIRIVLALAFAIVTASPRWAHAADEPPRPTRSEIVWILPMPGGGREFKARLLNLSPETATLLVDGQQREIALRQIARIERRGDSLRNGAIIGAVVVGGLCAITCGQGLDDGSNLGTVVAINAGLGALIGMGIDALHQGRTPIYPATSSQSPTNALRPSIAFRIRF